MHHFQQVTLLITHYNRSNSLKRLLEAFKEQKCSFEEVVISDDGSKPEHLNVLKALQSEYNFRLITSEKNKGLGNNINKGQESVKTSFTLYVQEDFRPTANFPEHFQDALEIMQNDTQWDIIRLYAYGAYPYLKPYGKGFSEMVFNHWNLKAAKLHYYSDHPHLRKSNFLEKFGRYAEGPNPVRTEYLKCVAFIQKKGRGLFYNDYKSLFIQENSSTEPSTWQKKSWKTSKNPVVAFGRSIYRQLKYNYDINFLK